MTDEQIKQRVTQILNILHDPKIGFNGLFNDVKEEYLAELRKKIDRNKPSIFQQMTKYISPTILCSNLTCFMQFLWIGFM